MSVHCEAGLQLALFDASMYSYALTQTQLLATTGQGPYLGLSLCNAGHSGAY